MKKFIVVLVALGLSSFAFAAGDANKTEAKPEKKVCKTCKPHKAKKAKTEKKAEAM